MTQSPLRDRGDAPPGRPSDALLQLLAQVSEATRGESDPLRVVAAAMRLLRETLGADRCAWAEVEPDEDHFVFLGDDVAPGVPRAVGRYPVSAFGATALATLRAGRTLVSADVLLDGGDLPTYAATGVRALIAVPVHRGPRFVGGTGVHMRAPRAWTDDEVDLARGVTERCWEALERARAERALRESEARYRMLVDRQSEMLCHFRRDGTILFVNRAYAAARGVAAEHLIGRSFWDFIPPEGRDAVEAMLDRLTPEAPEVHIENRFETTSGERWTRWSNRALAFDEAGRWVEAQSSGFDISDRKRVEEALVASDRRKDEFLAMLAHELRNPLASLRGAAEVLRAPDADAAGRALACDVVERQTRHLARIVDDLLDVARINEGRIILDRAVIPVAEVVRDAAELCRKIVAERRHALEVSVADEALYVDGDATRLVQVVGNLLHNAAKYTDPGGRLNLSAGAEGGSVVMSVRDDGHGIAPELLPRVFDLFVQGHRSLARSQGGLGIGLTLVRRIVELHGGTVLARSEGAGRGSEFVVRLPRAEAPAAVVSAPTPARPAAALRVLVVEDNVDAAELMQIALELRGHEVRVVHDGAAAAGAARAFAPDAVLCDLGLPGMDGYAVARALREDPVTRDARLLALSGYGRDSDKRRALDAGFDAHMTKPVEPAALDAWLAAGRPPP